MRTISFITLRCLALVLRSVVLFAPKGYECFTAAVKQQRQQLDICKTEIPSLTCAVVTAVSKLEHET